MSLNRSELRERCMIILYQIEIMHDHNVNINIQEIIKNNIEIDNEFVKNIIYGVTTNQRQIDEIANRLMNDWLITRIDKTGAAILRMAIYELQFTETPEIVVINEAVELAKKYCDDPVRKMINAVLDKIINE